MSDDAQGACRRAATGVRRLTPRAALAQVDGAALRRVLRPEGAADAAPTPLLAWLHTGDGVRAAEHLFAAGAAPLSAQRVWDEMALTSLLRRVCAFNAPETAEGAALALVDAVDVGECGTLEFTQVHFVLCLLASVADRSAVAFMCVAAHRSRYECSCADTRARAHAMWCHRQIYGHTLFSLVARRLRDVADATELDTLRAGAVASARLDRIDNELGDAAAEAAAAAAVPADLFVKPPAVGAYFEEPARVAPFLAAAAAGVPLDPSQWRAPPPCRRCAPAHARRQEPLQAAGAVTDGFDFAPAVAERSGGEVRGSAAAARYAAADGDADAPSHRHAQRDARGARSDAVGPARSCDCAVLLVAVREACWLLGVPRPVFDVAAAAFVPDEGGAATAGDEHGGLVDASLLERLDYAEVSALLARVLAEQSSLGGRSVGGARHSVPAGRGARLSGSRGGSTSSSYGTESALPLQPRASVGEKVSVEVDVGAGTLRDRKRGCCSIQ